MAKTTVTRKITNILVLAWGLCVLVSSQANAAAGRVQFVAGEVKIQGAQGERTPKKGDNLDSGDTIITAANSSMQIALADGGMLAVRPNTQLRIDDYVYSGKPNDKNNKSFFSLTKGTFRSITGAIGQNNKEAYRINTPGATMGIRGSDHEAAVILPPLPGESVPDGFPAAGTYSRVIAGQTFIKNGDGIVIISPNQVGFAPAGGGVPRLLPKIPSFFTAVPKPPSIKKVASSSGDGSTGSSTSGETGTGTGGTSTSDSGTSGGATTTSGSGTTTDGGGLTGGGVVDPTSLATTTDSFLGSPTSTTPTSPGTSTVISSSSSTSATSPSSSTTATTQTVTTDTTITMVTGTTTTTTGGGTPPPPLTTSAPLGSGLVGAVTDIFGLMGGSGGGQLYLTQSPPTQDIQIASQNEVYAFVDNATSPTVAFDSTGSALINQGSFTFSDGGRVDWGRWIPGYTFFENGAPLQTIGDFHYVFSKDITPPSLVLSGTLTGGAYSYVGGTSPTDLNGIAGSIITASTSLNVNFTTQSVIFNVGTQINGVTLTGSAQGSLSAFIDPNLGIFSSSGNFTYASGQFVGSTAAGAIVGFDIDDGVNGALGTAVFQNTGTPPPPPPPPPTLVSAPLGSGLVGSVADSTLLSGMGVGGSTYLSVPPPTQDIQITALNEVYAFFDGTLSLPVAFDSTGSTLIDQGGFTFNDGGRVDWGRWTPGYSLTEGGVPIATIGDLHYAFSQNITDPMLVISGTLMSGTYSYVGGPAPTDQNGIVGAIIPASTSLNVDFTNQMVIFNVGTSINGNTLIGTAQGPLSSFIDPNSGINSLTGPATHASGQFVGPTAAGAIVGFDITDGVNGAVGAAAFAR